MNRVLGAHRCLMLRGMSWEHAATLIRLPDGREGGIWQGGQQLRSAAQRPKGKHEMPISDDAHTSWHCVHLVLPSKTGSEFPSSDFCFFNVPLILSYIRLSWIWLLTQRKQGFFFQAGDFWINETLMLWQCERGVIKVSGSQTLPAAEQPESEARLTEAGPGGTPNEPRVAPQSGCMSLSLPFTSFPLS